MAQRVYLLCIKSDLVDFIARAVGSTSDEDFDAAVEALRVRAQPQTRGNAASRRYAQFLDKKSFDAAGRIDDYYLATALRPYLLTSPSGAPVRETLQAVRYAADDAALDAIFSKEIARVETLVNRDSADEEDESGLWPALVEDMRNLRGMRRAAFAGIPFSIDENRFEGKELAETYGFLLGATLGRVAGLCEPSWWMGRNFWLGLMIAEKFSLITKFTLRNLHSLSDAMTKLASSPGHLFDEVGVPGYEHGFPLMCEGYSSGLIFGADAVGPMLQLMTARKSDWIALASRATGYEESAVVQLFDVVVEAFDWAAAEGCSLMEGDELVGAYGYR